MLYRHNDHNRYYNVRAFGSDAAAVFMVFLAVVSAVMALGVWLFDEYLAIQLMIGIAFVSGLIVAGIYGARMAIRREKMAQDAARERRKNKQAEAQKQIDAMLRGNSNIPKVNK